MNVGVAMYGTPREMCMRVTSPSGDKEFGSVQQLSIKSVEVSTSEPHSESSKESEEACDSRLQAARRMAVVNSSKSSPSSIQAETGFGEFSDIDSVNVNREGGTNKHSRQNSWKNWKPDTNLDQSEGPSVERSANKPQCCEEGSQMQETVSGEISENSFWSEVNEQRFQSLCDRQTLSRCFQAWKSHIFCKRAAARQLYRQQLLRKGLGALQWAVHLRRMQLEIAQQKHASALLAVSFRRWKEAVAKQSKKQTLQPEPYSYAQSSSVVFSGVGRLATMTTSAQHQLTVGYLKEAEQACRVEGELWTQLHRRQRGDEFCWRAQAVRDMRRLAAAFRLWRLQKELLSKEEVRLEEARALLKKKQLQNTFQVWRSRCLEMEQVLALATQIRRNLVSRSFSQGLERCRLREALRLWHQMFLMMKTIKQSPKYSHKAVHKDPLALLVSEDLSTSSGFHSSPPATFASQSSLEKEYSLSDSSQQSFSSILTAEDVTQMPYYSSLLQLHQCTELPVELGGELYLQASFPPESPESGGNWFVGGQFQSLALHTPGSNVQPLASYSMWEEDCSSDKEVKCCWHQAEKGCLQRYFFIWSARTQWLVKAQQYCRLIQLSRPFLSWHHWVVENKNQKAAASLKRHVRCCQMAFSLWKKRLFQKVEADRRFRCHIHQTAADTLWHWRSYWQKRRGCREKGSLPAPAAPFRLFPSAIHRWLMIYRNQSRVERLLLHQLVERPGVVEFTPAHAGIQENNSEVDSEEPDEKRLGRKYLRWWRHTVMLRQCQRGRRLRCLARGWRQWKEASSMVLLAQALDKQQLIEKTWRMWRRQHLQSCVVQSVLKEEARSLLTHAFGRWRQLTTFQLKNKGHC
ncbi:uncharacterized protein C1orf167 homolog isoform X5 [Apteryx mantelli]|uniref:Uncharacterized protein C1orf167 homolog isoform X5 n=1 Tax=Apteryx mantelli TaxID=2696672 RepID=A0ABM4FQK2_9AVES